MITNKQIKENIDVIILAGGLGTRLRPILHDAPKCLAVINGKSFIDILIDNFIKHGFKRFIISVGYKKEKVIYHLSKRIDCDIIFSEEDELLGTGGAIKNTRKYVNSNDILIVNGDSFIDISFFDFYNFHLKKHSLITIIGSQSFINHESAAINYNYESQITSFTEKPKKLNTKYINAGSYFFKSQILNELPSRKKFSIEIDYFSKIAKSDFYLFKSNSSLYDIGTPNGLQLFKDYIRNKTL